VGPGVSVCDETFTNLNGDLMVKTNLKSPRSHQPEMMIRRRWLNTVSRAAKCHDPGHNHTGKLRPTVE